MLDNSREMEKLRISVGLDPAGSHQHLPEIVKAAYLLTMLVLMPLAVGMHGADLMQKLGISQSASVVAAGLLGLVAAFSGLLVVLRLGAARHAALRHNEAVSLRPRLGFVGWCGGGAIALAVFWLAAVVLSYLIQIDFSLPWGPIRPATGPAWKAAFAAGWYGSVPFLLLKAFAASYSR